MKKEFRHYFAYGSNMNLAQMDERCSSAKVLGIARLPNHRVEFYGYSKSWDGAQETVIPEVGSDVWGVLYELQFYDCDQLDAYEDARLDGTGAYFHYPVDVIDGERKIIDAMIYKKDTLGEAKPPSTEYLNFILQGAKEQGLPDEYIKLLENKTTKPASYAVPVIKKSNFDWISATCGDCGDCGQ